MLQDSTGETPGRGNGFTPSGYYESSRRLRRLLNKAASGDQKDAAAMSRITSTIATITCTRPKLGASRATNQAVTKADAESRARAIQPIIPPPPGSCRSATSEIGRASWRERVGQYV